MHTPVNHVHLIGSLTSEPAIITMANGLKMARFAITTRELRKGLEGKIESENQWHKIVAWGKWVQVLEEFAEKGVQLAIEGKLRSRFFKDKDGRNQYTTEIEVKDLVFLGHGRLAQSA
jgi:single-strand DNA-binding protein